MPMSAVQADPSLRPDPPAALLTIPEVASRLRVSRWTIYRAIEAGRLPALRVGAGERGALRVDAGELERWLFSEPESEA